MNIVRKKILKILQCIDVIQEVVLNFNYNLHIRLKNLQNDQKIILSELKDFIKALFQTIKNCIMLRFDDYVKQIIKISQMLQLNNA